MTASARDDAPEQVAAVATLPAGPLSPRAARTRAAALTIGTPVIVEGEGVGGPVERRGTVAAEPAVHRGHAAWRERGYIAADYWTVRVHLEGEAEPRPFALERVTAEDRRGCRRTGAVLADEDGAIGEGERGARGGLGAPPGSSSAGASNARGRQESTPESFPKKSRLTTSVAPDQKLNA